MKIEQKHFDAMMNGTKCKFWDAIREEAIIGEITGIFKGKKRKNYFECDETDRTSNCEPLKTEMYIKSPLKTMESLLFAGYKPTNDGTFIKDGIVNLVWESEMLQTCCKPNEDFRNRNKNHPYWLEERDIQI